MLGFVNLSTTCLIITYRSHLNRYSPLLFDTRKRHKMGSEWQAGRMSSVRATEGIRGFLFDCGDNCASCAEPCITCNKSAQSRIRRSIALATSAIRMYANVSRWHGIISVLQDPNLAPPQSMILSSVKRAFANSSL